MRWSRLAEQDLEDSWSWIAQRDPAAARRWAARVLELSEVLLEHPELGGVEWTLKPEGRIRSLVITKRTKLFYTVLDEGVFILRVWPTRRALEALHLPVEDR